MPRQVAVQASMCTQQNGGAFLPLSDILASLAAGHNSASYLSTIALRRLARWGRIHKEGVHPNQDSGRVDMPGSRDELSLC